MADPYCPFVGKKGRPWGERGELDLPSIAERVVGVSPDVEEAARALVAACRKAGVSLERVQDLVKTVYVSAPPSGRSRR